MNASMYILMDLWINEWLDKWIIMVDGYTAGWINGRLNG